LPSPYKIYFVNFIAPYPLPCPFPVGEGAGVGGYKSLLLLAPYGLRVANPVGYPPNPFRKAKPVGAGGKGVRGRL